MRGKHSLQRLALLAVHREDHLGPLEHARVDADHRVFFCPGGTDVEIGALAENPLRGCAAVAVEAADEQDPPGRAGMGHDEFG